MLSLSAHRDISKESPDLSVPPLTYLVYSDVSPNSSKNIKTLNFYNEKWYSLKPQLGN